MKSAGLISSIICRIPSRGSDSAAAPASCTRDRRRAGADLGKGGGVQRSIPSLFIPRPRQLSHLSQPPNDLTFAHGAGRAGEPAAPRIRPDIPPERRVPLPPRKSGNDGHSGKKGDKEKQCDGAHGESRLWKGGGEWRIGGTRLGARGGRRLGLASLCLSSQAQKCIAQKCTGGVATAERGREGVCARASARPHLADGHGGCRPPPGSRRPSPRPPPCSRSGTHTTTPTHVGRSGQEGEGEKV
jgi:hypothetical protein